MLPLVPTKQRPDNCSYNTHESGKQSYAGIEPAIFFSLLFLRRHLLF